MFELIRNPELLTKRRVYHRVESPPSRFGQTKSAMADRARTQEEGDGWLGWGEETWIDTFVKPDKYVTEQYMHLICVQINAPMFEIFIYF